MTENSMINDRILYKKHIKNYLKELELLSNHAVSEDALISKEELEKLRIKADKFKNLAANKFLINFSDKEEERFKIYLKNLYLSNSNNIYFWTHNANFCGLYLGQTIQDLNYSFPYEINEDGVVVILTSDFKDKLLFDFFEDELGNRLLEIEAQGQNWSNVCY